MKIVTNFSQIKELALPSPFRPRKDRDDERVELAGRHAAANGAAPLDVALARVAAVGLHNPAFLCNLFKLRIEAYIDAGTGHPAVRARFGTRVQLLQGLSIDAAIQTVEGWYREERWAFQIASLFGRGPRLSLEVLRELRLILRLIRTTGYGEHFPAIVGLVLSGTPHRLSDVEARERV